MLKKLLEESFSYLSHFFQVIDVSKFEEVVESCATCKGLLIFTGVGKSGFIGEKIAATLTSTGTKALYLPPMNFLHGDIGILSEKDTLFMLSKSGESEELLNLIPFVRRRKSKIISIVSNETSRLAKASDLSFLLPVKKELCDFDLIPTTSSQVQLIFGDILSIALMKKRGFNLAEYALNHPAGSIGKKLTLAVKDIMIYGEGIPRCSPSDKLSDVLVELTQKKCGALVITNEESKLEGIFTDGDLRRALQIHGSSVLEQTMQELMTPSAISIEAETLAWDAMKEMQKNPGKWVMVTPVIEDGKVVGMLRMHDIIQSGIV
jgi:arabinose-5-phosphate isomerase